MHFTPRSASAAFVFSKGQQRKADLDESSSESWAPWAAGSRSSPSARAFSGPGLEAKLSLFCLPQYFGELRASLINCQPLPKQEVLAQCFRSLMEGVEQNLSIKNRDR